MQCKHFQRHFARISRRFGSTNNICDFQKILKGDPRLPSYLNLVKYDMKTCNDMCRNVHTYMITNMKPYEYLNLKTI